VNSRTEGDAEQPDGGGDALSLPWVAFGSYLRTQRQLAQLSLRQLAELTKISNPYLSQIERGLHQPSVSVIRSIAEALDLSAEDVLAEAAGISHDEDRDPVTERAIRNDPRLDDGQKQALLAVLASMVREKDTDTAGESERRAR
jgi:transcriptional regulator with XRE-family HTH domain